MCNTFRKLCYKQLFLFLVDTHWQRQAALTKQAQWMQLSGCAALDIPDCQHFPFGTGKHSNLRKALIPPVTDKGLLHIKCCVGF